MEIFLETFCKPYRWAPSTALQLGLSRPQRAPTIPVEVRSPGKNIIMNITPYDYDYDDYEYGGCAFTW